MDFTLPVLDQSPRVVFLYHERQNLGMCGVHTVNALLQRAAVDAAALMQVARALDEEEERLVRKPIYIF